MGQRLLCRLAAWYIRLVRLSGRWTVVGAEPVEEMWDRGEPFIAGCWHGRLLMMPLAWRPGVPGAVLVSHHRDGELIAGTVAHFGVEAVRGSSSRGGTSALFAMVKRLQEGTCIGVTPDGPRGPRMRASEGIVTVAQLSGRAVVPVSCAASRRLVLGTWDRFVIPLPFSRGVYVWGTPIRVPRGGEGGDLERARRLVEEELNRVTAQADRLVGQAPGAPEPAPSADAADILGGGAGPAR